MFQDLWRPCMVLYLRDPAIHCCYGLIPGNRKSLADLVDSMHDFFSHSFLVFLGGGHYYRSQGRNGYMIIE